MKKWRKAVLWTVSSVFAVMLVMMAALQLVLSPEICTSLVQKYVSRVIDGKLSLGEVSVSVFSHFPAVTLDIDDFSITYPSRFACDSSRRPELHNRMELAGSYHWLPTVSENFDDSERMDTLASFKKLSVSLNVIALLRGDIRVKNLEFTQPRAFIHVYSDSTSNLDVLNLPKIADDDNDGDTSSFVIRNLVVKKLFIGSRSNIVFTDTRNDMFALMLLQGMNFRGKISARNPLGDRFSLGVDSLMVTGNYNSDTLLFALDRLDLGNRDAILDFDAAAGVLAATKKFGRVLLPLHLGGRLSLSDIEKGRFRACLDDFSADLASIHADACLDAYVADTVKLKGWAQIKDLNVQDVLDKVSEKFVPDLALIQTDAKVNLRSEVDGWYVPGMDGLPAIKVGIDVPSSRACITGTSGTAQFDLHAGACARQCGSLDIDLSGCRAELPGVRCELEGKLSDALGNDPEVSVDVALSASLGELLDRFGNILGINGKGELSATAKGRFNFSNMSMYNLSGVCLDSKVDVTGLDLSSDDDSLKLYCDRLSASMGRQLSGRSGKVVFAARLDADSLLCRKEGILDLHGRGVEVEAVASPKVIDLSDSVSYSPLRVTLGAKRCFVKASDSVSIKIRRTKNTANIRPSKGSRKMPVVKLNSSSERVRLNFGPHRLSLRGLTFDARAKLADPSAEKFPLIWDYSGGIRLDSAKVSTPAFPIKTAVTDFKGSFDNDNVSLDTLRVTSGASDVEVSGKISRLKRAMLERAVPRIKVDIRSDSLAFDELMGAFATGQANMEKDLSQVAAMSDEKYDTFVQERIEKADSSQGPKLVVIPRGIDAEVNVHGSKMKYSTLDINSFDASMVIKRRCLQIRNITAKSNAGNLKLEAFYSTQRKRRQVTGFDLSFSDISASQIISLIPSVDTLMPLLKTFDGNLNCTVAATAMLDTNMNIIVPSAVGVMRISGKDLHFNNDRQVEKLMRRLLFRKPKQARVDSMTVEGVLKDSQLEIFPFILKMDRWTVSIAGVQGMDKKFSYHASLIKSPLLIKLGATLYGDDFDHMNFKLGKPAFKKENAIPSFSATIDTTRVNLATGIRNVFERGVDAALKENARHVEMKEDRSRQQYTHSASLDTLEELSASEKAAVDSLVVRTP